MKKLEDCKKKFTEHPEQAGETYIEHLCYTVRTAASLIVISMLLLLHGLLPFTCQTAASDRLGEINGEMIARRRECEKNAGL
jgi:hypothetical protein